MTAPVFWLVLAAEAVALAVLARVVLHVPKNWRRGEMHGPVPRDGEPLEPEAVRQLEECWELPAREPAPRGEMP